MRGTSPASTKRSTVKIAIRIWRGRLFSVKGRGGRVDLFRIEFAVVVVVVDGRDVDGSAVGVFAGSSEASFEVIRPSIYGVLVLIWIGGT